MQAEAPTIAVNARDLDSVAVQEAVGREVVEIGVAGHRPETDIRAEALFTEPLNLVCRDDDPICATAGPIPWKMIAARTFISNGTCENLTTPEFIRILEGHTLHVRSVISLLSVVRAGVGITVLPGLSQLQSRDGLSFLPLADPSAIRTVYLLSRADRSLSPAALRFIEIFRRVVAGTASDYGLSLLPPSGAPQQR
jgi:DNA-binding transcriptional LysR family regulator